MGRRLYPRCDGVGAQIDLFDHGQPRACTLAMTADAIDLCSQLQCW